MESLSEWNNKRLLTLRKTLQLSQTQLANELGISRQSLVALEHNKREFSKRMKIQLNTYVELKQMKILKSLKTQALEILSL